jgi:UDP-galactopyranose mutase
MTHTNLVVRALLVISIAFFVAGVWYNTPYDRVKLKTPRVRNSRLDHDIVIVGAGLSGAVLAREHASAGHKVLILEKRDHIGGNCYDYVHPDARVRVSKYGAHLFHTNNERVWAYVNRFAEWARWDHRVLAWVEDDQGRFVHVPVPVNINTVNTLVRGANLQSETDMATWLDTNQVKYQHLPQNSEEMARSRVGDVMYDKIFGPYTQKQWNMSAASLGPEVTARIPVRASFDDRYFDDKYQALPSRGYTAFFEALLDHVNISVELDTDYFDWKSLLPAHSRPPLRTYFTGPIDRFFASEDHLEYRSLRFESEVVWNHGGHVLPASVVNYPSLRFPYTRIIEYKQMLGQQSPHSVIVREYPSEVGEPYYPVPNKRNKDLYARLVAQAASLPDVTFVGRLANYKYFNMDEAVANALRAFDDTMRSMRPPADVHVVTSVFQEQGVAEWMASLCSLLPGKRVRWFVYDKGSVRRTDITLADIAAGPCISMDPIEHTHLPANVGREGHSWLKYIEAGDYGAVNVFLQGAPESLMPDVATTVDKVLSECRPEANCGLKLFPPGYASCNPNDEFRIMDFFRPQLEMVASKTGIDVATMCHHYRGQFAATSRALRDLRTRWPGLIGSILIPTLEAENDPPMGHALERLWVALFQNSMSNDTANVGP